MADVFISYSRKDQEFVRRLDDALRQRNREAWVDWEGIRAAEEFMPAIYGAIEGTDTFIFVLSPDSIVAPVCLDEIAHAVAQNKRMIPIVARDVNATKVPKALAKLNWIFCRDSDAFDAATDTLITALDTDLGWVRAHTRLLTRALEWEAKGRNHSFVLRGDDLRDAEQWLAQAGADKERQPTALQTEHIIASRRAETARQRTIRTWVAVAAVIAIVLAILAWTQRGKAVEQKKVAILNAEEAERQKNIAVERQAEAERQSKIALSRQLAAQAQAMAVQQPKLIARAGLLAIEAAHIHPSLDTDQALRGVLAFLPNAHISLPCKPEPEDIAFSSDGNSLLVADGDHVLRRWNLPTHQMERELPLDGKTKVMGISPDLAQVALWREGALVIRRLKDGRELSLVYKIGPDGPDDVVFNSDASFCIARTSGHSSIYDCTTGKLFSEGGWWATFDEKGEMISYTDAASGGVAAKVRSGQILTRLADLTASFRHNIAEAATGDEADRGDEPGTALSGNGKFVAIWHGREARAFEIATQRLLGTITNDQEIIGAEVDDRGRFLVVRGERGVQTRIWRLSPVKEFARFTDSTVKCVRFSPDGSCFATIGDWVESVRLWRITGGEEVATLKSTQDLEASPAACALDPAGEYLLMRGTADEAWVRSAKGGRKLATLPHRGVQQITISRHNDRLVTAGGEDGIRIWQLQRADAKITGAANPVALKEPGAISAMCLTDDGAQLITGSEDATQAIHIWNTANGEVVKSLPNEFGVDSIACSADGGLIAAGNGTSDVRIISARDGKIVRKVSHGQHVNSVSLSADGRYLATAAWRDFGYKARLWDIGSGKEVAAATHDREVGRVFFSADGHSLVTAADDGTSRLWSLHFDSRGILDGTTEVARIQTAGAASMTADARYLATASDGAIRIWYLRQEDLIAQVEARSFRNLTRSEWADYMGSTPYRKTSTELPEPPEEPEETPPGAE